MQKILATKFKEKDSYSINLSRGLYLIDGEYVDVKSNIDLVQVKDVHNIVPVTITTVTSHYENATGDQKMTVEEYDETVEKLRSKGRYDEYDDFIWQDLESEFEYRKFKQYWKSVPRQITSHGDPIPTTIQESVLDTGNRYIKSDYLNGKEDPISFTYSRYSAIYDLIKEKFEKLGMKYSDGLNHYSTRSEKVWSNSSHSGIEYLKAFGKYICPPEWKNIRNVRGSLDELLVAYEEDAKKVDSYLQTKYNLHYGYVDQDKVNFSALLEKLHTVKSLAHRVDSKQKTTSEHFRLKAKIQSTIEYIESLYKTKE